MAVIFFWGPEAGNEGSSSSASSVVAIRLRLLALADVVVVSGCSPNSSSSISPIASKIFLRKGLTVLGSVV